jgi:hypothetical protein
VPLRLCVESLKFLDKKQQMETEYYGVNSRI